jgi:hypothetical protein
MIRSMLLAALALGLSPMTLAQSDVDCRAIAAATVAELRAGHAGWSDEAEQLARSAAGAACVKATTTARPAAASRELNSTVVTPAGIQQPASARVETAVDAADDRAAADEGAETASGEAGGKGDDSSWNPFSDIKFNKVSASPNKKPYERRRQSPDEE